jgi:hypothetical protein|nr:MAG TPA: hypothetical protein [Bacteriophage sp.]
MLKMVDGTGIIGVDMICPLGVSTPQPPNYDRVELEGTGILVLPNSLNALLERLELGGKTDQVQTTGKNLFDKNSVVNGVIIADGTVTDNAPLYATSDYTPVKPSVTYACTETGSKRLKFFDADKQPVQKINFEDANVERGGTLTTGETTSFIRLSLLREKLDSITLNEGSKSIPYEPYTGGKPSPSPEYPQEIKNVGKWNDKTKKYEVDVKITGKNLLDIEKAEVSGGNLCTAKRENNIVKITAIETVTSKRAYAIVSGGGICLKSGKTYFLNGRKVGTSNMTPMFAFFKEKNNGELLKMGNFYTPNEDICIDIGIYLVGDAIRTGNTLEITDIIVCEGKDAAQYQPYTEQTLTITSDRPITKWDRLVEQGGQIGWLYGSVIATIDETASISLYAPNGFYAYVKNIDKKEKTGYCDKLYAKKMSNGEPFVLFGNANNNVLYTLNTQEFYGKTVSEIKEKLKEYPLNIIGKSETTEFVPLPQSEQNAIRALKTYYPTTVITADGGELYPDIKVTYRKEI